MNTLHAYEEITLSHGSHTVRLRPSLRAASILEAEHNGLEPIFRNLDEFNLATIRQIITTTTADRGAADALLTAVAHAPLGAVAKAFHGPLTSLCLGFVPRHTQGEQKRSTPAESDPLAWSEVYARLYRAATGWLQWTPDAAWNATPTEIAQAFEEHLEMLKAIHGGADTTESAQRQISPDQRAANIEAGLDPEFDREGLRSLKARMAGGLG